MGGRGGGRLQRAKSYPIVDPVVVDFRASIYTAFTVIIAVVAAVAEIEVLQ